jgi:hypothetical protein
MSNMRHQGAQEIEMVMFGIDPFHFVGLNNLKPMTYHLIPLLAQHAHTVIRVNRFTENEALLLACL